MSNATYPECVRKELIHFLDTLREYERNSEIMIGKDERESAEFVDIYIKAEQERKDRKC